MIALSLLSQSCNSISKPFESKEMKQYQVQLDDCVQNSLVTKLRNSLVSLDQALSVSSSFQTLENDHMKGSLDSSILEMKKAKNESTQLIEFLVASLQGTKEELQCLKNTFEIDSLSMAETLSPELKYKDFLAYNMSIWGFLNTPRLKSDINYPVEFDKDLLDYASSSLESMIIWTKLEWEYWKRARDGDYIDVILLDFILQWDYDKIGHSQPSKVNLIQAFKDKLWDCDIQSTWLWYYLEACRRKFNCFKGLRFHIEPIRLEKGAYVRWENNHAVLTISFIGKDNKLHTKRIDPVNMRF